METGRKKCIVMDCENHTDEGEFVGDLCSPCHRFVASGRGIHSQAYRNARQLEPRKVAFDVEFLPDDDGDRESLACRFCMQGGCDRAITLRGHGTRRNGLHAKCLDRHEQVLETLKKHSLL